MAGPPPISMAATTHFLMPTMQVRTLQNAQINGHRCITLGAMMMQMAGWTIPAYHGISVTQVHPKMMMTINLLQAPTNKIRSLPPHRATKRNLTRTWMKEATLSNPRTAISLRALETLIWTTILPNK